MFRRSGKVWSPISASACYGAATVGPAKAAQFARSNDQEKMLVADPAADVGIEKNRIGVQKKGTGPVVRGVWTGALGSPLAPGGRAFSAREERRVAHSNSVLRGVDRLPLQ